jgi:hypothetical protein
MKNKTKKYFDSVQMVREIRDAIYLKSKDPEFDIAEFKKITEKWTMLLKQQKNQLYSSKRQVA